MGQFAGLGARGRARGEWGRPGRVGGSVCRRVNAAGRLTVVSRASRRGGDEDLPTQVAGRSRHCSKNVAASKNALSAPAVRWFQGERTRACRLYTRGGSLNAGLSLPESTRDGRVTDHVQSLRLVRDENWPRVRRSSLPDCMLSRCQPKKSLNLTFENRQLCAAHKSARAVSTPTR